MSNADQESWTRVKERLRADVGDDVYSSWFARMDLEGLEDKTVRLSVPTRFLKSWIQSHYAERLLACWLAHDDNVARIELPVRSAVLRTNIPVKPRETAPAVNGHAEQGRMNSHMRTLPANARCAISPPRSSCTASARRSARRRHWPSRKRCAASASSASTTSSSCRASRRRPSSATR